MKNLKGSKVICICIVLVAMAFMASGCASSGDLKTLQAQVDEVSLKADNAMSAATTAQKTADDCLVTADKANKAAQNAEAAALRAEQAADKAEAVFMKNMKK
ncbi:MAG: hypothetical protein COX19_11315 [Desulfobacterales bacterium CG23_combo_of_CG06-09_8_20_14_all_51_8]|nr:MAG: hypothetical protein COX19_11315 [Desulfobacterales bacterium CG23_combo_of_CG06-09_8_20_14_all_51_8]